MKINTATVQIEQLAATGEGIGQALGREAHIWNSLPGEMVEARFFKKRRGQFLGVAEQVIQPSVERRHPKEDHFLSCSPWSILSIEAENKIKHETVVRGLEQAGITMPVTDTICSDRTFGYRNKMEFSFTENDGILQLAFFERGRHYRRAIDNCLLADEAIQRTARDILAWLQEKRIPSIQLKSLIIRSNQAGQAIAALFATAGDWDSSQPPLSAHCLGLDIYFSEPRSPASVPTRLMASHGINVLTEEVLGKKLTFGALNFFQINIPVFEKVLKTIEPWVLGKAVVDLYSGVGSISLALSEKITQAHLVEIDRSAIDHARANINANHVGNFTATAGSAEKCLEAIVPDRVLIVDPPRVGLHPAVIKKIIEVRPMRLVYLSCNPTTQARDLTALQAVYHPITASVFNFFPGTPHIESLVILELIK